MKLCKVIAVFAFGIFLFGCEKSDNKIVDESQLKQIEKTISNQSDPVLSGQAIAIPNLSQNQYSEFSNNSSQSRDKTTDDENASFNENYTNLMKNRYPSSDITKFNDLSSEEGRQAISKKMSQDNELSREVSDIFYSIYDLEIDSEEKTLKIIADGNDILENIDKLKSNNFVNQEVTQVFLNTYPILATKYVVDLATTYILHNIYFMYDQLDSLKVSVYLGWNDQFGMTQEHLIYKFNFDRKLYNKIHWDGFHPKNLDKVVRNLHYSAWYQNHALAYS